MFNFIRKRMDKKGFTLVELLVVIAVLGIIAGIAIPRMTGVTASFKQKADIETARNIARQVELRIQMGDIKPTEYKDKSIPYEKFESDGLIKASQQDSGKFFQVFVVGDSDDTGTIQVHVVTADNLAAAKVGGVAIASASDPIHTQTHNGKIK